MTGFRIGAYFAYAVFFLSFVVLAVAAVWLIRQGTQMTTALFVAPGIVVPAGTSAAPKVIVAATIGVTPTATRVPPTGTPAPTRTATPTATGTATAAPTARATDLTDCIDFMQAGENLGATQCVQGVVVRAYNIQATFYLEFDQAGRSFFAIAPLGAELSKELIGRCVRVTGELSSAKGRPFLRFQPDELQFCPSP